MGRPQFAQPGTKGGETVAATDRPTIVVLDEGGTDPVASGASETVEVFAPSASIYRLLSWRLRVDNDGDATSGSHQMYVRPVGQGSMTLLLAQSGSADAVRINPHIRSGTNQKVPTDEAAQIAALKGAMATSSQALQIIYDNDTDAAQENARDVQLAVRRDDL